MKHEYLFLDQKMLILFGLCGCLKRNIKQMANWNDIRHALLQTVKVNGQGIDCIETFSPIVKPATILMVLSLATYCDWPVHQLDIKNAFLQGHLNETVYMHQPPGFHDPKYLNHVCHLKRSLYGLKQAPRAWFNRFAPFLKKHGFIHSKCDSSLFIFRYGSATAYLLLYGDDIILTASTTSILQHLIKLLAAEFAMTDLGAISYFLGISTTSNKEGLFLS